MTDQTPDILAAEREANSLYGEAKGYIDAAAQANEAYGRVREGVFFGTFALDRAFPLVTRLFKSGGWKLCGPGFDDVEAFMESLGLDKFRSTANERKSLIAAAKAAQASISNRAIGRAIGVDHKTVGKDLSGDSSPDRSETPRKNKGMEDASGDNSPPALSGAQSAKLVAGREARKARDATASEARIAEAASIVGEGTIDLRKGDFRTALADLQNVDAIITDPPYPREFLPRLRDLAAFAHRVLKPDGVMAVLLGQTWLEEAYSLMSGFRPYRWTACYLTDGAGYVSHQRKVQSNWKPLIIYGGGPRFGDVFRSEGDGEGKERHKWGQDFSAFRDIIQALTKPGDTIVDPFAGGGTTLFAAKALGRHAIAAEIDPDAMAFKVVEAA